MTLHPQNSILYLRSRSSGLAWLMLMGLVGLAVIVYTTYWGAGLVDDSFIYITSAKNLVAGNGLAYPLGNGQLTPLTHFPPLFSLALAAFQEAGVDALHAARVLNAVLFGANVILVGLLTRITTRSWLLACLGASLALVSDVLIETHSWAMSEPLYLFFSLACLLLLARYLKHPSLGGLALAGLSCGLAFLTRYIGLSLLLAGAITLLLRRGNWRERLRPAVIFAAIAALPMTLWLVRNLLLVQTLTDRPFEQHWITFKQIQRLANTLLLWFIPGRFVNGREFVALGGVLVLLAGLIFLAWRLRSPEAPGDRVLRSSLILLLGLQIGFHLLVLVASKSFFDPVTPLNDRILSPILPLVLVLVLTLVADLWQTGQTPIRIGVAALVLFLAGFYLFRTSDLVPRLHATGLGFARKGWHTSQTMQAVRELPGVPLFSNSPASIYMWTGRPAYSIYSLEQMRASMQAEGAVLVLFNSVSTELYDVAPGELTAGLTRVKEYRDGAIYQLAP